MNKINKYFLMGTVALTGMAGFSACSSENNDSNPTPGESNGVVKTQFAINIPKAAGSTRQAGSTVQEGNSWTFRGMYNIRLLSFTTGNAATSVAGTSSIAKNQNLDKIEAQGGHNVNDGKDYKVYSDVEIPVSTDHFLLYAAAPGTEGFAEGALEAKGMESTGTANGISFALKDCLKGSDTRTAAETKLKEILNAFAGCEKWQNDATTPMQEAYKAFTSLKAGSANAVLQTVQDLYNFVKGYATTGDDDQSTAKAIKDIITKYFTIDNDGLSYASAVASVVKDYPTENNLPEGSAVVAFNATSHTFSYVRTLGVTTGNHIDVTNITYPAALWYFANTPLKATPNGNYADWPATVEKWTEANAFSGWADKVESDTRVIALKDPVNYANALLETTIQLGTGNISDSKDNTVTPKLKATAILVGNQPEKSNWEFLPASGVSFNKTVYDNVFVSADGVDVPETGKTATNYTLVMDNSLFEDNGERKNYSDQTPVSVAVEFVNNGEAFYGVDGKILPKQKFYLIAKLTPTAKTISVNGQQTTISNMSVFMRDYKTTLNLTVKSLKNAYNTIPDIRSDKLQLGLAVDLTWQQGLEFNVDLD